MILCIAAPNLLSPLGGLLVDRVKRRTLLAIVNPLTALAVLPLLLVHDSDDVWIIYAVALVYGSSYVLLASGQSALLATMLPPDLLAPANAALQTVREALRLVAPLAGAGLYTLAGGGAVALLDAATFLAATVALLALQHREPRPEPRTDPWWHAVTAGARHISGTPALRRMIGAGAVCASVIGFSETLMFELPHALGRPDSFVGVLMAAGGVGAIIGALSATRVMASRGETTLAGLGMTIFALGSLLMCDSALPVVLVGKALFGFGLPWILVSAVTLIQRLTPGPLQGRAYSASEFAFGAPQTLSIAAGAGLVALIDYRFILLVQAAVVAAAGLYLLNRMHPWRPWTRISTTSSSMPTASRARTRPRSWPRWRRSAPKP